jgi:hypothetical protein
MGVPQPALRVTLPVVPLLNQQCLNVKPPPPDCTLLHTQTTSNALSWTLGALACHPEALHRLEQVSRAALCSLGRVLLRDAPP